MKQVSNSSPTQRHPASPNAQLRFIEAPVVQIDEIGRVGRDKLFFGTCFKVFHPSIYVVFDFFFVNTGLSENPSQVSFEFKVDK